MKPLRESLIHDPIHGYVPFVSIVDAGETSERTLLDHPWLQRLRQIHQLQTAWWVYPSAEHTRFQHVVGTMHMASRAVDALYKSLAEVCPDVPSRGFVECTMRLAALLHDVGHGPFGHFFDAHFLRDFVHADGTRVTHETLGAHIIRQELGDLLSGVRRCPNSELAAGERIDPAQIAWLITRPTGDDEHAAPRWLAMLRSLFCGLYTVDNMDFVLRDAYMSGYSSRAYDLDRLLRYSFFTERGLTIHHRGLNALLRFMQTKSELFRAVYFHRTVRAIDKTLEELFRDSKRLLFPGNPLEHLDDYQTFTEWSLLPPAQQGKPRTHLEGNIHDAHHEEGHRGARRRLRAGPVRRLRVRRHRRRRGQRGHHRQPDAHGRHERLGWRRQRRGQHGRPRREPRRPGLRRLREGRPGRRRIRGGDGPGPGRGRRQQQPAAHHAGRGGLRPAQPEGQPGRHPQR
jgi:HD superfamily phosphohydrolase